MAKDEKKIKEPVKGFRKFLKGFLKTIGIVLLVFIVMSNIGIARFFIAIVVLCLFIGLYLPYDGQRFYLFFRTFVRYLFSGKKYVVQEVESASNIRSLFAFKGINGGYIEFGDYYGGVDFGYVEDEVAGQEGAEDAEERGDPD